ncbi:MAG TPA: hypothetical protein PLN48_00895 [Lachnospiraceae bacterium]|nr:hypothetical protein [Lachnospiraceae bacterium]
MSLFGNERKPTQMTSSASAEERLLAWPDSYYNEREAKKRREMLDLALEKGLSPEEDKIRKELFHFRYPEYEKNQGSYTKDAYLASWMVFRSIGNSLNGFFSFKKKNIKEVQSELEKMGFAAMEEYGKKGKDFLYLELRHMTTLYFYLCREDKQYGNIILGIGTMGDESLASKAAAEAYEVGFYVPKKLGLEKECLLWSRAVSEGYSIVFPDSGALDKWLSEEQ